MTWRQIAIYYALAIVLGAYFFVFEWRPTGRRPFAVADRPVRHSQFLPIPRDEIQAVLLRHDGTEVSCRKDGQRWTVIQPTDTQVTSDLVTSFVENLTPDTQVRVMAENPQDLSPYGLQRPRTTVLIKNKHGNVVATVFLGDENPASSAVYARRDGSSQVVLLGHSVGYYRDLIFEAAGTTREG